MQHNNDARNMPTNEMLKPILEINFALTNQEMTEEKMFAETDPEKRQILFSIYGGMICS